MSDSASQILNASAEKVARVLDLGSDQVRVWHPDEYGAIFRHQMAAPVSVDLAFLGSVESAKLRMLTDADGLLLKSFRDLFEHPRPPVELLQMVKEFAKLNRDQPDSLLPTEITGVLYFISIAAALVRCGQRITTLTDSALVEGFDKAAKRPWIDDASRELLKSASVSVGTPTPKD